MGFGVHAKLVIGVNGRLVDLIGVHERLVIGVWQANMASVTSQVEDVKGGPVVEAYHVPVQACSLCT